MERIILDALPNLIVVTLFLLISVLIIKGVHWWVFQRTLKEKFTPTKQVNLDDPNIKAKEVYGMAWRLAWQDAYEDDFLKIEKDGDDITIYLKDGEKRITVLKTNGVSNIYNNSIELSDQELVEFHPGLWVEHLVETFLDYHKAQEEERRAAKARRFAKVNDAHIFD
jgi:hypothetical protein